jgi:hypothetical protein
MVPQESPEFLAFKDDLETKDRAVKISFKHFYNY